MHHHQHQHIAVPPDASLWVPVLPRDQDLPRLFLAFRLMAACVSEEREEMRYVCVREWDDALPAAQYVRLPGACWEALVDQLDEGRLVGVSVSDAVRHPQVVPSPPPDGCCSFTPGVLRTLTASWEDDEEDEEEEERVGFVREGSSCK